uniref:Hypoxia up-regulated protein 1 n=1 Tax=Panagrellus redivivus TaxID=6233 RepID=A0A7E4V2S0_PANRE
MGKMSSFSFCIVAFLLTFNIADAAFAAMSVDLGSQYLKIGLVQPGIPMEIVLNKESQRKTATLIAFHNGERLFGELALQMSYKFPDRVFPYITDLVGKQFENPVVQNYIQRYPYLNVTRDPERGTVVLNTKNDGSYNVETLLGMILWNAREQVVAYGKIPVRDIVITVPSYFNQAERQAVITAAKIAGLNVLQLISDSAGAAVNFVFSRRKDITEKAQNVVIYDIGASKTVATVLELKLAKNDATKAQDPVVAVKGVGYDRTLGGSVLTNRVQDLLIELFNKQHKTSVDVRTNLRAMAKLLKEAERVKHVLSANTETYGQIESLFEDKDFRAKVHRDAINTILGEYEARFMKPLADALRMAEINVENVDQVIFFGAGTRIPKLQDALREFFKGKEPNRFLNTDESACLGALYQAAFHSKGFKVKPIVVQELVLFPVQIGFDTSANDETDPAALRRVDRTLFSYKSAYPTNRKIMTFTSHTDDFTVNLHYGKIDQLTESQLLEFGDLNITDVELDGVSAAISKNVDEGHVFKGVKAFFLIDYYGIVRVDGAEAIIEQPVEKKNSTLGSIVESIGSFFGSGKDDAETKEGLKDEAGSAPRPESTGPADSEEAENKAKDTPTNETEKKSEEPTEPEKPAADTAAKNTTANETESAKNTTTTAKKAEPKKPKILKSKLKIKAYNNFPELEKSNIEEYQKVLSTFEKNERAKAEREAAHNELEARVYDIQDRLTNEQFTEYASSTEVEKLSGLVSAAATWLEDDVDASTKTEDFKEKKSDIDTIVGAVEKRQKNFEERPTLVERLNDSLTKLDEMINKMKDEHKDILPEDAFVKPVEVVKETRVFITEKVQIERVKNTDDDDINGQIRRKGEKVDRVAGDLALKFTRKLKDIEKAAKAAAAEAAKAAAAAANATANATATESEPKAETDAEPKTESEPKVDTEPTPEAEAKTESDQTADEQTTEEPKADKPTDEEKAHEEF